MCKMLTRSSGFYTRSFNVYKKEKEIEKRGSETQEENVSFLEAKKIVGPYMGENSYVSVAQRADTTNQDNKYRALVEKLIQLEMSKFQEHLKKQIHFAEFYQAPAQQRVGNGERSNVVVQTKTYIGSTTPTWTTKSAESPTKQLLHASPIHEKVLKTD